MQSSMYVDVPSQGVYTQQYTLFNTSSIPNSPVSCDMTAETTPIRCIAVRDATVSWHRHGAQLGGTVHK